MREEMKLGFQPPILTNWRCCPVFHETVVVINWLITPSLRVDCKHAHPGLDQQILWGIIERRLDFWDKDTPDRCFTAILDRSSDSIGTGNLLKPTIIWVVNSAEGVYYNETTT